MRAIAFTLCLLCALSPAARGAGQKAFLRVEVNGVPKGDVLLVLREKDVLMKTDDLSRVGLGRSSGCGALPAGTQWIALRSLAADLRYELDEKAALLRITARPECLESHELDLRENSRPVDLTFASTPSFFVNYSAHTQDGQRPTGFTEAGLGLGSMLVWSGASMQPDGRIVRGLSNLTYDDPADLFRFVAGDLFAGGSALGSALTLGGLGFTRELSLDPYFVAAPHEDFFGATATPSRVELYQNDRLVRSEPLAPGPFALRDVPGADASSRVVVRDAFGRAQEFAVGTHSTAALLAPGLSDFAYQLGLRRDALGRESFAYGPLALFARHRVGVTSFMTLGARGEAGPDLASGGPTLTVGTGAGTLDLALAGSRSREAAGAAGWASYGISFPLLALSGEATWMSPRFSNLAIAADVDRPRLALRFRASTSAGFLALSGGYSAAFMRDGALQRRVSVSATARLGSFVSLSADASVEPGHPERAAAFAGLTFMLGRSSTTFSAQGTRTTKSEGVVSQMPLPAGSGFGYTLRAGTQPTTEGSLDLAAQSAYGRYEASYGQSAISRSWSATVSGALVAVGGSVFATRPVQQGFALIEVPGVDGVRAYVNNQEIGRTNSRGQLLVPEVMPYYGNRFRIADQDLPLQYGLGSAERTVAGPARGAALARFSVQRVRAFTGQAMIDGKPLGPGDELRVDGKAVLLGLDGRFYLENVSPGRRSIALSRGGGAGCTRELLLPDSPLPVVQVGQVACGRPEGEGRLLFVDADGDGRYEPGEPLLPGVRLKAGDAVATTDTTSRFAIAGNPQVAGALELPAGFRLEQLPSGDLAVRKPKPLQDLGSMLLFDSGDGTLRVQQLQAATIPLRTWLASGALTKAEDQAVQRLGTDVLDAPDLRVLLVVHPPAKAQAVAFEEALRGARAALRYLRGPAMVPSSRLIWTIAEAVAEAPKGSVDILLVRLPGAGARTGR